MRMVLSLVCVGLAVLTSAHADEEKSVTIDAAGIQSLEERYEIEIVWRQPALPADTTWGVIEGRGSDSAGLTRYQKLLKREFSLYPQSLVAKTKLQRIVLCQGLTFAGQRRFAIPDFEHDTYYLDVGSRNETDHYLCKVIHHDFFHIIDYRDDGLLYEDEHWKMLNPPDFKYGRGGASALGDSTTGALTDRYPGFLNNYSTTGVEEDKAEIFAHLIVSNCTVSERIASDEIVKLKVDMLKRVVHAFCADIDGSFWTESSKVDRR